MSRMNWKRVAQDIRFVKAKKGEFAETRHLLNKLCCEQKRVDAERRKEDARRALILQAAVKAGIYRGHLPVGPTLRSTDAPEEVRKEQKKRSFFKRMSRTARSDKSFKKEDRQWNGDKRENGASLNPA